MDAMMAHQVTNHSLSFQPSKGIYNADHIQPLGQMSVVKTEIASARGLPDVLYIRWTIQKISILRDYQAIRSGATGSVQRAEIAIM